MQQSHRHRHITFPLAWCTKCQPSFSSFQISLSKLHTYTSSHVDDVHHQQQKQQQQHNAFLVETQSIDYRSISHLMDLSVSSIPFLAAYNLFFRLFFAYYYTACSYGVQLHDSSVTVCLSGFCLCLPCTSIAIAICTLPLSWCLCVETYMYKNLEDYISDEIQ